MRMTSLSVRAFLCFIFLFLSKLSFASDGYFVYTKFQVVNLRVGPGKSYPISWVIKYKGEPLKVYHKVDNWLKCKDYNGDEGWAHLSNVSKRAPNVVIKSADKGYVVLYARSDESSRKLFRVEGGRRVKLKKCNSEWCKISVNNQDAWVLRDFVWGAN